MRDTYIEGAVVGRPSAYRVFLSLMNLVAAVAITAALSVQIADLVLNDAFRPERYFSYFTIETSLANIVLLAASGIYGLQSARDPRGLAALRANFVAYAFITGAVYNVLLRNLPEVEGAWVSDIQWPNEVTHVWIPVYFVLDWILNPHRRKLPVWTMALGFLYPLLWFGFTLARGQLTGWYPYSFLNPNSEAGWMGVGVFVAGIGAVIFVLIAATVFMNLIHHRLHPVNSLDR